MIPRPPILDIPISRIDAAAAQGIMKQREAAGLSRKQLGELCGASPELVTSWETCRSRPSLSMAWRIAALLGCTIEDFFAALHPQPDNVEDPPSEGEWDEGRLTLTELYYGQPDRVFMVLMLCGDVEVDEQEVAAWSNEQRKLAAEWALSVHYSASDNEDVIVPPRPDFIRRPDYSSRHPVTGVPIEALS